MSESKPVDKGMLDYIYLLFYCIHCTIEVDPWCGGKCLPPKVIAHGFESGNQPL